jgi:hypothetical protein
MCFNNVQWMRMNQLTGRCARMLREALDPETAGGVGRGPGGKTPPPLRWLGGAGKSFSL